MRECERMDEREALPLLVRGLLGPAEAARVEAHVAACAACSEERALLERSTRIFDAATPRVDVAAIVAALPAPGLRPALTVVAGGRNQSRPQGLRVPRYAVAAAASLVLMATLSFAALKSRVFGPSAGVDVAPDTAVPAGVATATGTAALPATDHPSAPATIVAGSDLSDLGVTELETLLAELDQFEATVAAEPVAMQRPVTSTPEGL